MWLDVDDISKPYIVSPKFAKRSPKLTLLTPLAIAFVKRPTEIKFNFSKHSKIN